jgi:hypothetical protein
MLIDLSIEDLEKEYRKRLTYGAFLDDITDQIKKKKQELEKQATINS